MLTGGSWAFRIIHSEKPRHEEDLLLQAALKKMPLLALSFGRLSGGTWLLRA